MSDTTFTGKLPLCRTSLSKLRVATDSDRIPTVSAAREEGVPGTVNLRAKEGEETHYGQALFPVPSADPNDPLQVCRDEQDRGTRLR